MKPIDELTNCQHSLNIIEHKCNACGKDIDINKFKDTLSAKEYQISGFCQKCQDSVFG
ncbi:MAG: hypothetical protein ACTSVV_10490 [Promethearchaeota archaeon]